MRARRRAFLWGRYGSLVLISALAVACTTKPESALTDMSSDTHSVFYGFDGQNDGSVRYQSIFDPTLYEIVLKPQGQDTHRLAQEVLRDTLRACGFTARSSGDAWWQREDREQGLPTQNFAIAPELGDARISVYPEDIRREDFRLSFAIATTEPDADIVLTGRVVAHRSLWYDPRDEVWVFFSHSTLDRNQVRTALEKLAQSCTNR